jgi:predicted nucleic acid-binding protein
MLERGSQFDTLDRVLEDIQIGAYELDCGEDTIPRVRELMARYADLPLGFADASVIACAEQRGGSVLSLDRDFWIVAREGMIRILPK